MLSSQHEMNKNLSTIITTSNESQKIPVIRRKIAIFHKKVLKDEDERTDEENKIDQRIVGAEKCLDSFYRNVQTAANLLSEAEKGLKAVMEEVKPVVEAARRSQENTISLTALLAYAQRMSGTTAAPPYWRPGMQMVGFIPPAPLPEMMRAGAFHAFTSGQQAKKPVLPEEAVKSDEAKPATSAPEQPTPNQNSEDQNEADEERSKRARESPAHNIFPKRKKAKFNLDLSSSSDEESEEDDS